MNRHWWKIGSREGPDCDECGEDETVRHFILECPGFDRQRKEMERTVGKDKMTLPYLLGTAKGVAALVNYVIDTDRWNGFLRGIQKGRGDD